MQLSDSSAMQRVYSRRSSHYEYLHHWHTLWCDVRWRRRAAEALPRQAKRVLDLCTGTGLVLNEIRGRLSSAVLVGVDLNTEMLSRARYRSKDGRTYLVRGDAENLGLAPHTFDAVVSVCGLGGIKNPALAIREIKRVLRPSGLFFGIEMCTPPHGVIARLWHKRIVEPLIRRWWGFRDIHLDDLLLSEGFTILRCKHRMERGLGSICEVLALPART